MRVDVFSLRRDGPVEQGSGVLGWAIGWLTFFSGLTCAQRTNDYNYEYEYIRSICVYIQTTGPLVADLLQ